MKKISGKKMAYDLCKGCSDSWRKIEQERKFQVRKKNLLSIKKIKNKNIS